MEEEIELTCPYCNESITILVDTLDSEQSLIEDCSVCCRPIQLNLYCEDGAVVNVQVGRSDS